jgi:hypothetical protein
MPANTRQSHTLRLTGPVRSRPGAALAGVVEHVLSGERRAFDGAEALPAGLLDLQGRTAAAVVSTAPDHSA